MIRRIVVTRGHEWLRDAWINKSFAVAAGHLEQSIKVAGVDFDPGYHPVRVPGKGKYSLNHARALGFNYAAFADPMPEVERPATYSTLAHFENEEAIERLKADRKEEVVGVFVDLPIAPFPVYCDEPAVGTHRTVAQKLRLSALRKAGLSGKNVRVAVVDTGIDGAQIPVHAGWSPVGRHPGTTPADHGTMVAFDVRIAAPDATILDWALLQSTGPTWGAFLSDALTAFSELIALLEREPGPLVANNSWGLYNRQDDAPVGSPENYSANPDHPVNQIVGTLVGAGADVCFAAGNCGADCPANRCGPHDVGPGASIHGANSHPDAITVAAVTVERDRLGYSSQGPGGIAERKPDICGYSHFAGSGVWPADSGTSAASPVVAGVIAALRQNYSSAQHPPPTMKGLLQKTARSLAPGGWSFDLGYGVIDATAALKALNA